MFEMQEEWIQMSTTEDGQPGHGCLGCNDPVTLSLLVFVPILMSVTAANTATRADCCPTPAHLTQQSSSQVMGGGQICMYGRLQVTCSISKLGVKMSCACTRGWDGN